ncbi:MAG: hypothetical protein NWF06_03700 [Candidatus Bathyarchaeota archaeon]|nr:hypothetical protein [Candidatus Bathyarchaeum sp.]
MIDCFLLLNVEHFDLTAWIFWVVLACLGVLFLILCFVAKLVSQRKIVVEHKVVPEKPKGKAEDEPKGKPKSENCVGKHYIGFLRDSNYPDRCFPPSDCLDCLKIGECLDGKPKRSRNLLKRFKWLCLVFLVCSMVLVPSFGVVSVFADERSDLIAETSYTVFAESQWAHVSVDGQTVGSVAWKGYGSDVQLIFYAYNDAGLSFDQFVIEKGVSYLDPFEKFYVFWEGAVSVEGEIFLKFYSFKGQTTTVVEGFAGEVSSVGRPDGRVKKYVISEEGEILDVFDGEEKHVCSFEWSYRSVTTEGSNETFLRPCLLVYEPDGDTYDMKVMNNTLSPIVEFLDVVGFMADSLGEDYVKWVLYSGSEFTVRSNQGFEDMALPSFRVDPVSLSVEPGQVVSVSFFLPEGVSDFEASWENSGFWDKIVLLSDEVYGDGEHVVEFKFLDSAKGDSFSVKVECEQFGTTYSSSAVVRVVASVWEGVLIAVILLVPVVIFAVWFVRYLSRRMVGYPSGKEVSRRATFQ